MSDQEKIIKIILKYHPNCQAIYFFGSFADGKNNKNSDVDIAISVIKSNLDDLLEFSKIAKQK